MGSRIISSLLAMALIFALPVFSFADGEELKDSGSPEVSMMAMRSIAANEGISLAAAAGDSGHYGYNISPYSRMYDDYLWRPNASSTVSQIRLFFYSLPAGTYSFNVVFSSILNSVAVVYLDSNSVIKYGTVDGCDANYVFTLDETSDVYFTANFPLTDSEPLIYDFSSSVLRPVEGISSGYTYSSGIIDNSTRSIFSTIDAYFGNQPAGKYLINIYHWGDSYNVTYQISDPTESYYLPCSTDGSVTTLVYNHPGGDFTLEGSFTASNDETSVVDGNIYGSGYIGDGYHYVDGEIQAYGPLSWVFNIKDIVAIPYEQAADSNFGFFAPIIGFFNDHFSSMKSFIASQIDKIAGDDETKSDVDNAQGSLDQEVQELGQLSTDLTTQTGNLEQQFTTDFAIPTEVLGGTDAVQQIYNFLFSSLGIFSIFIWLPVVLAVIKKLLRL